MSETLTRPVLEKYKNRVFVETGSYKGGGIQLALDCGFEDVRSVEFLPDRFENVQKRFDGNPKVKVYQGDSAMRLVEMIADVQEPITFWLDGHSVDEAPLWEELRTIERHPIKTHTILIDDRHAWVRHWQLHEEEIKKFILQINPSYQFSYEKNWVHPEDILVARIP